MNNNGNANFNNSHLSQGGANPFSDPNAMAAWRKGNQVYTQAEEKRDAYNIDITAVNFDGDTSSKLMSSMELSEMIADRMAAMFVDFDGCIILMDNRTGFPYLQMYFKEIKIVNQGDRVKALEPINRGQGQNIAARYQQTMGRVNKVYRLTEAANDILGQLVIRKNNNKINWNDYCTEVPEPNSAMNQNYNVVVQIKGFDFEKILKMIYGNTVDIQDPETDKIIKKEVRYDVSIIRPLTQMQWNTANIITNYQLSIMQLNEHNVRDQATKFGFGVVAQNTIPMYRSKMKF